ncbi:flagellar protein [Clostridioides difficile]|uniref:Flagellar protein n=3 Tax=Clostridioides difficile TaxID=1496 RepID=A0A9R0BHS7_CLODR|nr:flagellar export chaperone FliS [Clostridioides difficile]OFT98527.1 flagellar protein FliS [Clostridium sp. HMSC19E03]OFU16405.1 flagellar protein FliS [Clostridium sp. HMSC19C08]OFU22188.1 flagellar protein FliS [Clostridium sp. HMSC19C09]OFU25119.1 flagellar protein FliS [Clostridium sp. HMSC19C05]OFU33789.1 flagellar protein FliS [Clostridium sp. HMSC19B10]OFU46933.1 flagellar protein FliS [Clostridium sp. HMSC19B01]
MELNLAELDKLSKEELLLMLVDGTVKYTNISKEALLNNDYLKAHNELIRVQNIFTELMTTLDQDAGQWAKDMYKVYEFIKSELAIADENKDIKIIDDILPIVKQIRDTWHEVYNQLKI